MKNSLNKFFTLIWYQSNYFIIYLVIIIIDVLIFVKSIRSKFRKELIDKVVMLLEYTTVSILTSAKILNS